VDESVDSNILDYCSIDSQGKRLISRKSLGEKEQDYLDAMQSFYFDSTPLLSNEEFDNLEQELLWQGSKVAVLSSTEKKFLEASKAFAAGKSIMDDEAYDQLKKELKRKGSIVTAQGPRCSIRSKNMYSDLEVDYVKLLLLNLPGVLLTLGALFSVDDLTGFEITKAVELPEPFGIIALWGLVLPALFIFANAVTQLAFKDALILKGVCPNCGTSNFTYFGDILTVSGNRESNKVACVNCKSELTFMNEERSLLLSGSPPEPKAPKKAAPKKAPAGKDGSD